MKGNSNMSNTRPLPPGFTTDLYKDYMLGEVPAYRSEVDGMSVIICPQMGTQWYVAITAKVPDLQVEGTFYTAAVVSVCGFVLFTNEALLSAVVSTLVERAYRLAGVEQ